MKRVSNVLTIPAVLLLLIFLGKTLLAGHELANKPSSDLVNPKSSIQNQQLRRTEIIQKAKKLQMPFIANEGQVDKEVKFYTNTFGGTVFVTKEGEIGYSLIKTERPLENLKADEIRNSKPEAQNGRPSKTVYFREELIGGKTPEIKGDGESITKVNWFKGNDQSRWKTNIPTYEFVSLGEVYEGIEVKLKAHGDTVEKLFYVKQGADPTQIKLKLGGIKDCGVQNTDQEMKSPKSEFQNPKLSINKAGELVVKTALGDVKFSRPLAYQEINGKRVEVDAEYRIQKSAARSQDTDTNHINPKSEIRNPKSEYGFKVAAYDKTKDLVIDPLLASTFLGGSSGDAADSLAIDLDGNIYIAGVTSSLDFPITKDVYYTPSPNADVFVSKLDGNLNTLLASTHFGGSNNDGIWSLSIDSNGNIYVTGETGSSDFPTTTGAYDTSYNGGDSDAFISKLNGDLATLLVSTYLGGSDYDRVNSMAIDSNGNIYVTGDTGSSDFPTTPGAYNISPKYTFISKLNKELTSLLASTYFGGSVGESYSTIAIESGGDIYVAGNTSSPDFPTTIHAYDISFNGGINGDVFISRISGDLTSLIASTYLGGSSGEVVYPIRSTVIALGSDGNVYVTGWTNSSDFPVTTGAYRTSLIGGSAVFVSKLDGLLTNLLASTYLWSGYPTSMTTDKTSRNIYIAGYTFVSDFPTTVAAYDTSFNGGRYDAFLLKLNEDLTSLLASTYLGGSDNDYITDIIINSSGNIYVTGGTGSSDFPTTPGAYDTSYNSSEAFVSKFDSNLSDSSKVGLIDHFSFSTISSPQAVGVPFEVTISAKDAYGNTVTGFNGEVILSSSIGRLNPTKTNLTNGSKTLRRRQ